MLEGTLIYGLVNSVILLLTALGFNLTFGISGVANFAYGALYVACGFLAWLGLNSLGLPYAVSAPLAVVLVALVAAAGHRYLLQRVRGLVISEVIATFGLGLILLELFRYFGFVGFEYTLPMILDDTITIGQTDLDLQRVLIVGAGILLTGFLFFFTRYTKIGLAFRAIAQDERTALTLGINTDRIAAWAMGFGALYAGLAGIVILPLGTINVDQGYGVLINALAVCIVGGLGSTIGVVAASFILGLAQTFTAYYGDTHLMMLVSPAAILLVLLFKPSGLLGKHKELEERI
ncbi:branched-chain amino acid ABC transporter permease [Dethiosulfatarculus sandiegensis]|uniref:Branched-chain amino acid ABC transporter permease n=1 Tax=Dethiosulfatarculus sandiegensis TaxID=1429043 RepID=A0A0D2JUY3_9BACT|nr:branched-chain amino acid ABC transporter permease [Dethiosulfatarculus sandiegensis]KIX13355.1 branched-chain amino acid ABC transporter permease [Dethiosulfatarculus sandiegensis]